MRTIHETLLVWLLRLFGGVTLLALFAVFLPVEWMAASHRGLGLGRFPESTLTDYLTRSLSAMYAMHGGVLLVASADVRRFRPLVVYLGSAMIVFGIIALGIDLHAGLPAWWSWGEGPPVAISGGLVLYLTRRLPRA